ncbi:unnamed protein product [Chrysoparadoxa australica]
MVMGRAKLSSVSDERMLPQERGSSVIIVEEARKNRAKILTASLMVALVLFVILDFALPNNCRIKKLLRHFLDWTHDNPIAGILAFSGVFTISCICAVPGAILTLGAGAVFASALGGTIEGVAAGSAAVIIGATAGASISFALGRTVFHKWAQEFAARSNLLKAIDGALTHHGVKMICLLRLSPLFPFSVFNYVIALTGIRFRDFFLGTVIGIVPGTVAFVLLGATASNIVGSMDAKEKQNSTLQLVVLILGIVFTVLGVVAVGIKAKHVLNSIISEQRELERAEEAKLEERNEEGALRETHPPSLSSSESSEMGSPAR